MSNSSPYIFLSLLDNLSNIINTIVKKEPIAISSSDAASAQASFSIIESFLPPDLNIQKDHEPLKSMVNEVALTKIAILDTDPRVLFIRNVILLNNRIPENIRATNDQLDFYFPVLAPFN
jgi:hypothetical protein